MKKFIIVMLVIIFFPIWFIWKILKELMKNV